MSDYNKVILLGRLTRDPELRRTPSGMSVTTLRVASGRKFKTKTGEERDETLFIDCEVWGVSADNAAKYLVKGQRVMVDGTLRTREWKDKDGNPRQSTEIRSDRVVFLEKPKGGAAGSSGPSRESGSEEAFPPTSDAELEEIPF